MQKALQRTRRSPARVAVGLVPFVLAVGCSFYRAAPLPPADLSLRTELPAPAGIDEALERIGNPLVAAREVDVGDRLDPDEAALVALALNPDLVAARDARGEAAAQLLQAGLLPNPSLAGEADQPYGSQAKGLVTALNFGLSIDARTILTLPVRREVAERSLEQVDLGIAWQEWQVAQNARLLATRLAWLERRLTLLAGEITLEADTASALERAVAAGDVTIAQLGVQRSALEAFRRQRDDLEQIAAQTRADLLGLLGDAAGLDPEVRVVAPAVAPQRPPGAGDIIEECLTRRLDLEALRRGYEAQDARLRQAVIEQLPNVTIGVVRQRNESSVEFLGGLVNVSIPVFDHNQAQVALETATRERLRHEYEARVIATRSSLDALARVGEVIARRLPEVTRSIAPLARIETVERAAADRGDLDRLVYQTVRTALLEQRLQEATLSQGLAETWVGISTACGGVSVAPRAGAGPA
jgi:outer membrane protein, heavy metal efflux system